MNTSKIVIQKSCLFALAASSFLLAEMPAKAINLSLDSSAFNITQGIGSNSTVTTSDINVKSPPDGFGNGTTGFFADPFLLLGANPSNTSITTDSLRNNNSEAESYSFSISQTDITNGIKLNFAWAFQGNATGAAGDKDNFNIFLENIDTSDRFTVFTQSLNRTGTSPNFVTTGYGSNDQQTAFADTIDMTPGDYRVLITLNENTNTRSSAAGFDNFVVSNAVPFEFSPSQGLFLVGGFWGLSNLIKRRKQLADSSKDLFN
ncbi:hypothetical protein STA3757_12870 [Stanieria sp. NIES-3757]|nr:hypothetical protein STA3757_12870 [Stanieria sp. NIES-3757]